MFGTSAPLASSTLEAARVFIDTEEFIEDRFHVDITHSVTIDCEVTRDGWSPGYRPLISHNFDVSRACTHGLYAFLPLRVYVLNRVCVKPSKW